MLLNNFVNICIIYLVLYINIKKIIKLNPSIYVMPPIFLFVRQVDSKSNSTQPVLKCKETSGQL